MTWPVGWLMTSGHFERRVDPQSGRVTYFRRPDSKRGGVCWLWRGQWHGLLFKRPPVRPHKRYLGVIP